MAEGGGRSESALLPGAIADVHAFAVVDDSGDGHGVRNGHVLFRGGERPRQAAGRFGLAEDDVGERVAALLAGEPGPEYGLRVLEPGQNQRGTGVDDDDRIGGDGEHALDQFVLATGEGERGAIPALRLDLVVGADDDDRELRVACRLDRLGNLVIHRWAGGEVAQFAAHHVAVAARVDHAELGPQPGDSGTGHGAAMSVGRVDARVEEHFCADVMSGSVHGFAVELDAEATEGSDLDAVIARGLEGDIRLDKYRLDAGGQVAEAAGPLVDVLGLQRCAVGREVAHVDTGHELGQVVAGVSAAHEGDLGIG